MIPLELAEVARLCPGRLVTAPAADRVTGVQVDSRRIASGELFVAVNDAGASFVDDALAHGAAAALVPDDGFEALAALGGAVRDRSPARVAGITGSAGKTSTKDILAAICRPRVRAVAAEASLNNEIGVPLTLCRLEPDTEVCILELAMRGLGQIAELCAFAKPDVGVITTIGPAHVEQLGSLQAIAEAKSELVTALPPGGTAVVPADLPVARDDVQVIRLGEPDARVADGRTLVRWDGRRDLLRLHGSPPGAQRARRAPRSPGARRRARGHCRRGVLEVARGGGAAAGRRAADQRRVQRQPALGAGRARRSRRTRARPPHRRRPRRDGRARSGRAALPRGDRPGRGEPRRRRGDRNRRAGEGATSRQRGTRTRPRRLPRQES